MILFVCFDFLWIFFFQMMFSRVFSTIICLGFFLNIFIFMWDFYTEFPRDFFYRFFCGNIFFYNFYFLQLLLTLFIYFLQNFPRDFFTKFSAEIFFSRFLNFVFTIFDFFFTDFDYIYFFSTEFSAGFFDKVFCGNNFLQLKKKISLKLFSSKDF